MSKDKRFTNNINNSGSYKNILATKFKGIFMQYYYN